MKKDKIIERIKFHKENKKYVKITRKISKNETAFSRGYILDYSDDLVLLHEVYEFDFCGYNILSIEQISKLRYNKWDKYFDKIMNWEDKLKDAGISYAVDLRNWKSVFKSIKEKGINVIVQCEHPDIDSFNIGPIEKAGKKMVAILSFDPAGYFDEGVTSIDYRSITKVQFDDRYTNVFSKYTRHRKEKTPLVK